MPLTDRQCEVINALAFSSMNVAEASRMLGVHRNTTFNNILLIRKKTGLDPLDFFDLQELYKMAGGDSDADEKATVSS